MRKYMGESCTRIPDAFLYFIDRHDRADKRLFLIEERLLRIEERLLRTEERLARIERCLERLEERLDDSDCGSGSDSF